jgi:hypothetical protein
MRKFAEALLWDRVLLGRKPGIISVKNFLPREKEMPIMTGALMMVKAVLATTLTRCQVRVKRTHAELAHKHSHSHVH